MRVNGDVVRRGDRPLGPDDRLELAAAGPPPFPRELELVHEDADLLVVDKPAGLLTIATEQERQRTAYRLLADYVARQPRPARLFVVHRLDRETSGLVCFAKSAAVKRVLQNQFRARSVERVYLALVEGRVRPAAGTLRGHLVEDRALRVRPARPGERGREAVTAYRVLATGRDTTLLELTLGTGRRGQIRAQLAARGHPIVGDTAYGSRRNRFGRVCLHEIRGW